MRRCGWLDFKLILGANTSTWCLKVFLFEDEKRSTLRTETSSPLLGGYRLVSPFCGQNVTGGQDSHPSVSTFSYSHSLWRLQLCPMSISSWDLWLSLSGEWISVFCWGGTCKETSRSVEKKPRIYNCFLLSISTVFFQLHLYTHTHSKIMLMFNPRASLIFFIVDQPISGLPPLLLKNEAIRTSLVVQCLRLHSQGRRPSFDPWSGN